VVYITSKGLRRSVYVTLNDYCGCLKGTSDERLIDLSDEAFDDLAPLGTGKIRVTVGW